jgi:threonine dehydratase
VPVGYRAVLPSLAQLEVAAALVHVVMPPTPQYCWPLLFQRAGAEV